MNWNERIELATKTGYFTADDNDLANEFPTCAVGERLGLTKELYNTTEMLGKWSILGMRFWKAVRNDDVLTARELYERMQTMSTKNAIFERKVD